MSDKPSAEALAAARRALGDGGMQITTTDFVYVIASALDTFAEQAVAAERERLIEIVSERAQELAVIRHPTEREMGAFDAVSALEDEIISQTARTQEAGHG